MIYFIISILFVLDIGLAVLIYLLHKRVEALSAKVDTNIKQLLEWMDVLVDNQNTLQSDFKKLQQAFHGTQKEIIKTARQQRRDE